MKQIVSVMQIKQRLLHSYIKKEIDRLGIPATIRQCKKRAVILLVFIFFSTHGISQTLAEADTLFVQQRYDEAIQLYSALIDQSELKDTSDYHLLYKRALGYFYVGKFELTIEDLDRYITHFPQVQQAYVLIAFSYKQLGEVDKQFANLEKAILFDSTNLHLIKWRGALYLQKGQFAKAQQDLLKAKKEIDDVELETSLGMLYYSIHELDSAFTCFHRAIELDATHESTYLYAASLCIEMDQCERALQYLDILLLLNPENTNALLYKGIALIEIKQQEKGCRYLQKAFNQGEDDAADYLKRDCYDFYK